MEFKVRTESQSMLEKLFQANGRRGKLRKTVVPHLLREFNPDIEVESKELETVMKEQGLSGTEELIDYDTFSNIVVHYLVKEQKKEVNDFGHKQVIGLSDFTTP